MGQNIFSDLTIAVLSKLSDKAHETIPSIVKSLEMFVRVLDSLWGLLFGVGKLLFTCVQHKAISSRSFGLEQLHLLDVGQNNIYS